MQSIVGTLYMCLGYISETCKKELGDIRYNQKRGRMHIIWKTALDEVKLSKMWHNLVEMR